MNAMSPKASKTKITVSPNLELSRSPVDGMWRAYVPIELFDTPDDFETSQSWLCVAVAKKAKDAIEAVTILG